MEPSNPIVIKTIKPEFLAKIKEIQAKQAPMFKMMDDAIMQSLRLNDEQYNCLCEEGTDDELDLIFKNDKTYSEAKQVAILLKKFRT